MKKNGYIWLFLAVVVSLPISTFAVVKWYQRTYESLPVLVDKNHRIADFTMVNQQAQTVTLSSWKGKIIIADFFFTHCPVVCPKMTASLKKVQTVFTNDNNFLINSFTVDPERDSVAQMQNYAARFDISNRNWNLLTGAKMDIYRLARKSFMIVATDGDGGVDDFIHSEKLVLIDKQQRIRGYYDGTNETEVQQLIKDIEKLKRETD